ncbi:hypothetical protein [Clostridium sp. 001]|nr:hypothetical protein [Clostridium sp. 001]
MNREEILKKQEQLLKKVDFLSEKSKNPNGCRKTTMNTTTNNFI